MILKVISKRVKALGGRCIGCIGRLLRHPMVVKTIVSALGGTLTWVLKLLIIALFTTIGIALPVS